MLGTMDNVGLSRRNDNSLPTVEIIERVFQSNMVPMVIKTEEKQHKEEKLVEEDEDCDCLECVISPTTDVLILFGMDFSHSHKGKNKPTRQVLRGCVMFFVLLHLMAFIRSFTGAVLKPEFMTYLNTTPTFSNFGKQIITAYCGWSFFVLISICIFAVSDNKTSVRLFTRLSDETGSPENDESLKVKLLYLQNKLTCILLPATVILSGIVSVLGLMSLIPTFQKLNEMNVDFMTALYLFSLACLIQEMTHSIGLIAFTVQLFLLMLLAVRQESAELCEELAKFAELRIDTLDFRLVQRDCHNLSRMAYAVDQLFSVVFSLASIAFLIIFTYMLRTIIFANTFNRMFTFITLVFLFMLVTLWLIMAMLSTAVQKPYKQLCRISCINKLSIQDMERLLYLMNRIGGPPVGITLMKISVVTKPTVLKVFSLVVSIFVFLLQWRQLSVSDNSVEITPSLEDFEDLE
ncbi:uncharacterized protein LOC111623715 isoform X1 [Centruroides sculpturatus]|uniref:uncharacterized protein LOC111623715 isoform X1 n=1 Tax=Centruroides sculpturatus TaxID=218467 RepID=UPI000C6D8B7F|nr:uncharacterized protein LOC111623715 isoform X1 [Centruroides sculpturatus]